MLNQKAESGTHKELREIAFSLARTTERGLTAALDLWYEQYGDWLKEREVAINYRLDQLEG